MRRTLACLSIPLLLTFATSTVLLAAPSPGEPQSGGQGDGTPVPTTPLTIHLGDSDFLIGGFMDATSITRSTNTGAGIGSSFGSIPFTTTAGGAPNPTGNLGETRFSTQNSRLTLMATSKVGSARLKGYVEADFLGNTSTNLNVTSNSDTLRLRLYWVQYQQGGFEFLAGQSWSMLTPNRTGLSPVPGDLFYSQDVDTNYQLGLTWGRTTQFRFIAHAGDVFTAGVSLENPEQYVGSAVVLPAGFVATEVDNGASAIGGTSTVPNLYPDVIGKVALDPMIGNTHQHIDAAVVVRGYKTFNPATNTFFTATGNGESVNVILEPVKNLHLIATNFFSDGGGRCISNTNIPDFIVNPDASLSLVKSWSGIYRRGEIQAGPSFIYGYYSLVQATANTTLDANGKTPIGFGITGSQSANHKENETTFGIIQTFFRDPKIGGLQAHGAIQRTCSEPRSRSRLERRAPPK